MENKKKETKKITYFENMNLFIFLGALGASIIGFGLLKDDVLSTAYTMLDYFPKTFGVRPASDFNSAIIIGLFFSFTQVAGLSAALTKEFGMKQRITGFVLFIAFMLGDNWTDVVYRSQYLTGDIWISILVTGTLYTVGSEFSSGIAIALMTHYWRPALSEFLMLFATIQAKIGVLGKEWGSFSRAAKNREKNYVERISEHYDGYSGATLSGNGNYSPALGSAKNEPKHDNFNRNNNQPKNSNYSGGIPQNRQPVPMPRPEPRMSANDKEWSPDGESQERYRH